jgi:hypothetical protein
MEEPCDDLMAVGFLHNSPCRNFLLMNTILADVEVRHSEKSPRMVFRAILRSSCETALQPLRAWYRSIQALLEICAYPTSGTEK